MRAFLRCVVLGAGLVGVGAGAAQAQTSYPDVKISGRLQEQFYWFDNGDYAADVGPESNIFTRRARIEARGEIAENVSFFVQPSFEGGRSASATTTCTSTPVPDEGGTPTVTCRTTARSGLRLRDAWIEVRVAPEESRTTLFLRGGQEKRPFGRYELISSTNLPSIERGAGDGLPGSASNDLFEANGFLSHDVGASLRAEHELDEERKVTLKVGAYNGQGESVDDVNGRKSFGVRGTVALTSKLDVGGSWFAHDAVVETDSSFTHHAWGLDASWGKPGDAGLFVVGDYMEGDDRTPAETGLRGLSLVGAYNVRLGEHRWLHAVEPALRYDFADPNTEADDDGVTTLTAVLGLYLSSRAQFRVAYEHQSFQADLPSVSGVRSALTVNF